MNKVEFIRKGLTLQNLPVYEIDLPFIQFLLNTVMKAQSATHAFPHLYQEVPITIVDKELL